MKEANAGICNLLIPRRPQSIAPLLPSPTTTLPLSSRPQRTRISHLAELNDEHVCGSPQREAHALQRSHRPRREIRGEGSAVLPPLPAPRERWNMQPVNPSTPPSDALLRSGLGVLHSLFKIEINHVLVLRADDTFVESAKCLVERLTVNHALQMDIQKYGGLFSLVLNKHSAPEGGRATGGGVLYAFALPD